MKKLLSILPITVACFVGISAFAAEGDKPKGGRGHGMTAERRLEHMKENLSLTPEQVEKIKPILESDQEKMKALRGDDAVDKEDRRAKMREIMKSSGEELKAILTPEQQAKWKEQMEKRRERGGKGDKEEKAPAAI